MIVITGASRGLGRAIAETLHGSGKPVIGIARSTVKNLPWLCLAADVQDSSAVKAVALEIKALGEPITGLVNAAGIASMNLALMTPPATVERVITTNLNGTIYVSQAIAPLIIRSGGGSIVNFSTIAVPLALSGESVYAASKAGVEAFSRIFAREVSGSGVRVNCVAPGPIATDLLQGIGDDQIDRIVNQQVIRRRFLPSDVADLVEFLLGDNSAMLSGQVLNVGGV